MGNGNANGYRKSVLANGLRVISERVPAVRSVSLGVWMEVGSRDEPPELNGIAHFVEHMFFKGTRRRSASQIAREVDSRGGVLNAFTGRECTTLYAKFLSEHLAFALELAADLLLGSTFPPEELERERQVVLEEIRALEDTPDEYAQELLGRTLFDGHPMGRPILGTRQTVSALRREDLQRFVREHHLRPRRMLICAVGAVDHERLVELAERWFGSLADGEEQRAERHPAPPRHAARVEERPLEQVHLCLGVRAPAYGEPDWYALQVLNALLGGNMSSRLFQEIRERRGLAYAVYSWTASYSDMGMLGVYVGLSPARLGEALEVTAQQMRQLREEPPAEEEIRRAKEHLRGRLLLGAENLDARLTRLAKSEIYLGEYLPVEEVVRRIEEVSQEELLAVASRALSPQGVCMAAVGPLDRLPALEL